VSSPVALPPRLPDEGRARRLQACSRALVHPGTSSKQIDLLCDAVVRPSESKGQAGRPAGAINGHVNSLNRDENELGAACACRILPIGFHVPREKKKRKGYRIANLKKETRYQARRPARMRTRRTGVPPSPVSARRPVGPGLSAGMHGTIRNGRTGVRAGAHFPIHATRAREKKVARAVLTCRRARNGHKAHGLLRITPGRPRRVTVARPPPGA